MKKRVSILRWNIVLLKWLGIFMPICSVIAQQYNSDSWISKPHGTITVIPTIGQRNSMIMNTYSLFPRWEFTMAVYWYNDDGDPLTDDGYSTSWYGKYMFYDNESHTGGAAVKAGTGMFPGTTLKGEDRVKDALRTFWMNAPVTIPLFDNVISWDIMPGAMFSKNYGPDKEDVWAFTYSTRVAWYVFGPKLGIVGEVYGAKGQAESIPEYKVGLRWEPSYFGTFAITYGQEIGGTHGAGLEIGAMIFTPQFACIGPCKK